jgi:hypothetical protein
MRGRTDVARIGVVLLLLLAGCSAALPVLTDEHVRRAQGRWPAASLGALEAGRQKYIDRCGGCHSLHLPGEFTEARWRRALDEMQERSRTSDGEKEMIFRYLVAARPE